MVKCRTTCTRQSHPQLSGPGAILSFKDCVLDRFIRLQCRPPWLSDLMWGPMWRRGEAVTKGSPVARLMEATDKEMHAEVPREVNLHYANGY